MRKYLYSTCVLISALSYSNFAEAFIVHDPGTNGSVQAVDGSVKKVNKTAQDILNKNDEILKEVQKIREKCEGDRTKDASAGGLGSLGLTVDPIPGVNFSVPAPDPDEDPSVDVEEEVGNYMAGLGLANDLRDPTPNEDKRTSTNQSYQELKNSVRDTAKLVRTMRQQVGVRRNAITKASQLVGSSSDIKGAIDVNTQTVMQQMMTINEMIGLLNGVLDAQVAQNQHTASRLSSTRQALDYTPREEDYVTREEDHQ